MEKTGQILRLTKEKRYYMENHPGVAVENGSLDEVIVMMIQGETV